MCENLYDVRHNHLETNRINENKVSKEIKEVKVSKTLNLKNCTGKPRVFSNVPGVRCLNKNCSIIDEVGPTKITKIIGEENGVLPIVYRHRNISLLVMYVITLGKRRYAV